MIVRRPSFRQGCWCVVVADGPGPLDKEIEVIPCASREDAYQAYRQIRKEQGKGL